MGWQQDYKQSKAKEILENVTTLAPHDSSFAWSSRFADDTTRHFEAEAVTSCFMFKTQRREKGSNTCQRQVMVWNHETRHSSLSYETFTREVRGKNDDIVQE